MSSGRIMYRHTDMMFGGEGEFGFEDPHSEAKLRAASLAPGYLRASYLIIKLWEACKD